MCYAYSMQRSGNSYKVRLALAHLGYPYRLEEIDILKGEGHTPEFLAKNPSGQVPLLEAAPGRYIAESNAILWHLASRSPLRPEDRFDRAEALQWMFFEQHSIEPNIGAAYFWLTLVKGGRELQQHALEDWMEEGYRSLGVLEKHLRKHRYFVADPSASPTSRFMYAHLAHHCDYDLTARSRRSAPGSTAWQPSPGATMLEQPADMAAVRRLERMRSDGSTHSVRPRYPGLNQRKD